MLRLLYSLILILWFAIPAYPVVEIYENGTSKGYVARINVINASVERDGIMGNITISAGGGAANNTAYGAGWDGVTDQAPSQNAVYDVISGLGGGHDAVTLTVEADNVLSLSTQLIGLDTQAANYIFAGPLSGSSTGPSFRALADADIPSLITRDIEWDTWAEHPALTSGYMLIGNATNVTTPVNMSGGATIDNTGVITITNALHTHTVANLSNAGANVGTFLTTPSSANFFGAITDENGSGVVMGNEGATANNLTLGGTPGYPDYKIAGTKLINTTLTDQQRKEYNIQFSILEPDLITNNTGRATTSAIIWQNNDTRTYTISEVYSDTDVDNYNFSLFKSLNSSNITTDADTLLQTILVADNGEGLFYNSTTSLTNATIEAGKKLIFEHNAVNTTYIHLIFRGNFS